MKIKMEKENQLSKNIQELTRQIRNANSVWRSLWRGILFGIGSAIGASIIAAIIIGTFIRIGHFVRDIPGAFK